MLKALVLASCVVAGAAQDVAIGAAACPKDRKECLLKLAFDAKPALCEPGKYPEVDQAAPCCLSCVPLPIVKPEDGVTRPVTCDRPTEICTDKKIIDEKTGCPLCKPPQCEAPTVECSADAPYTRNAWGCPSCKKVCKTDFLPPCSDDKPFAKLETGCPSCLQQKPSECPEPTAVCSADNPISRSAVGCLQCKIPMRECARPTEPCTREKGVTRDANKCPTCKIVWDMDGICTPPKEACKVGAKPTRDDKGCLTCRRMCDPAAIKSCAIIKECPEGVRPERGDDCCPTCRPAQVRSMCADKSDGCRDFMQADTTPVCAKDMDKSSIFDRDTCCLACKFPKPPISARPDANTGKCSFDKFKQCAKERPVCSDDALPIKDRDQCCLSCKRPERLCEPEKIGKCFTERKECGSSERPQHIEGECCLSCKPAKPKCSTPCADNEVCIPAPRKKGDKDFTKDARNRICVKKGKAVMLKLKLKDAARRADFRKLDADGVKEVFKELIERFCENPDHEERCQKHKERLIEGMKIIIKKKGKTAGDADEIEVETPEDDADDAATATTNRRLLSNSGDLLNDAMADEGADSGITAEGITGGVTPVDSAATSLGASLALVAGLVLAAAY